MPARRRASDIGSGPASAQRTHFLVTGTAPFGGCAKSRRCAAAILIRFRDTLAVELLLEGVPMERVSILLGHSSVKITERHYAPWVQSRQVQLEADLSRVWRKDPTVLAEILLGDTA